MREFPSIIWNITRACYWNCSFCCINAYHVPNKNSLEEKLQELKRKGIELSLKEKLNVVNNLNINDLKIDISGGDPLIVPENMIIIKELSQKFGKENMSVSTTGKGLNSVDADELCKYVSNIEITYDFPFEDSMMRPKEYNSSNLKAIKNLAKKEVNKIAQIPLNPENTKEDIIKLTYYNLSDANVDKIFLMKFFQSGRGTKRRDLILSDEEYSKAISLYKNLESYTGPKVLIQRVFKNQPEGIKPRSLDISSDGMLILNAWAYTRSGKPIKNYILGDLKSQKLSYIIESNKNRGALKLE